MTSRKKVCSCSGAVTASPVCGRGEDRAALQREREAGGKEDARRRHVRRIAVDVQGVAADVPQSVQMAEAPLGRAVAPGAERQRSEHSRRRAGQDRDADGEGRVRADAELAADLHLSDRPGDDRAMRAEGDELPEAALHHGREGEPAAEVRWRDGDEPGGRGRPLRGVPDDQGGPERGEAEAPDAEDPDVERRESDIAEVCADHSPCPDSASLPEAEQSRFETLRANAVEPRIGA